MKHLVVGTAGHIDHGKSALVKALTGIDPDRLKEEKERGLTIDLGFAYMELPDGARVAFVDVPGHEKFVKNMLAGAAGMDIVILVVDATESVMPQTREHLDIMKLLGIRRGIVAITKSDLADEEMIEIVKSELEELVAGTFLESAPMVAVSSKTGQGIEDIRRLIIEMMGQQQQKNSEGLFRLPIDRVFTMKGFGTVVTGTVFSGWLAEDEPVQVAPSNIMTRARQLQSHNMKAERISAGMRAAINLSNVSVQELTRGDTLVRPGTAMITDLFDARILLLPSTPRKLPRTSSVKLHVGTSQQVARMSLIDRPHLAPGEQGLAQLKTQKLVCIFRGDHFVIRGGSPEYTIGGGVVLDVAPTISRRRRAEKAQWLETIEGASPAKAAVAFLAQSPVGISLTDLAVRTAEPPERLYDVLSPLIRDEEVVTLGTGGDTHLLTRARFDDLKGKVVADMESFFSSQSHRLHIPREELRSRLRAELDSRLFEKLLDDLSKEGRIEITREGIGLRGRKAELSKAQTRLKEAAENMYREAGFSPPTLPQAEEALNDPKNARRMLSLLMEEGALTRIGATMAYHTDSLTEAIEKIKSHFQQTDRLSVGDLKTILGISRKHAVPLLEYLDKIGLTTRVGDYRVLKQKTRS
ncbi:MAG: selenocysteine-specific translation elongation factor [Candidatus Abyssubacteria bacterium]